MIPETLLALAVLAAPAEASTARVLLKASAAAAPACRTSRVDDQLVRAALFSPESEQCPVARVGDEPIALRDLAEALELQHLSRSPRAAAPAKTPDMDFAPALDRLIDTRLLIQEAREVQVDATPEFRETIADFKESRQRTMLQQLAARSAKPDPAEVERLYRDAVREWEIASVLLEKEDDAKAFAAALAGRRELRRPREEVRRGEAGEGRRQARVRVAQAHAPRGGRRGGEGEAGRADRADQGAVRVRRDARRGNSLSAEGRRGARRRPRALARAHAARRRARVLPVPRPEVRERGRAAPQAARLRGEGREGVRGAPDGSAAARDDPGREAGHRRRPRPRGLDEVLPRPRRARSSRSG